LQRYIRPADPGLAVSSVPRRREYHVFRKSALRIYLDSCALNRLFDLPSQARVRLEAEAIEHFFQLLASGQVA
jgi:hypothetical protein